MKVLTDTHAHTVASTHAYSTIHDYFDAAKARGLELFAITDHAPTMPDSPHPWHFGNMKVLPRVVDGVAMLRGIEANILPDNGGVDIPDRMIPFLDIAIGSLHEPVFSPLDKQTHTRAVITALESGRIQILGHPGNPNYPIDIEEVIRAAKNNNVAIEINNSSLTHSRIGSEANCLRILEMVDKLDWKVVFASDAHSAFQLGIVDECIRGAKQVGFPFERVISATPQRLLAFLSEHDKPVTKELQPWLEQISS